MLRETVKASYTNTVPSADERSSSEQTPFSHMLEAKRLAYKVTVIIITVILKATSRAPNKCFQLVKFSSYIINSETRIPLQGRLEI